MSASWRDRADAARTTGRKNFHVVLVDNGRSKLIGTEAQDVLRCIRCSACINHCPIYGAIGGHAYGATYMGPIGAALNPGMMSVAEAGHHANASTFCGRCAEVCPVMIPLPKIMRHWRAAEYAGGLAPKAIVRGLGVWAFAAKRPALYRLGAIAPGAFSQMISRGGTVHALPVMHGWFAVRDFPSPQGKTFHDAAMAGAQMTARDDPLPRSVRGGSARRPGPTTYRAPPTTGDLPEIFAKKLSAQYADVRMLDSMADVPAAIADILRGRNMAARIHIPPDSELASLDLPNVEIRREPPGAFDAAVTVAPFAIAETGTLAYPSGQRRAGLLAFPPGAGDRDPARRSVVAELEDVLAALPDGLPSTLNLVSGPSRTGDIEQTMELGAHGPKALAVLVLMGEHGPRWLAGRTCELGYAPERDRLEASLRPGHAWGLAGA